MYDELTEVDIRKMQEEIEHRILVVRPQCLEDVKIARSYGDLSENFEYKEAKRQKNRNESRIRYLQRMIKTAKVVKSDHARARWACLTRSPCTFLRTRKRWWSSW